MIGWVWTFFVRLPDDVETQFEGGVGGSSIRSARSMVRPSVTRGPGYGGAS